MVRRVLCLLGCLGAVLLTRSGLRGQGQVKVGDGFQATDRFVFEPRILGGLGGLAYSPEGEPIVYESGEIRLCRVDGPVVLASFDPLVFGSFLERSPDGQSVIFGESSDGRIYRVSLSGAGSTVIDQVSFNYDLVFDAAGRGFLSANPDTQKIVLLDSSPEEMNRPVVVNIPGLSGPIAFDDEGSLYYGTADFSGDPERQTLHRFTRDEIEGALAGDPIDFEQGEILLAEMPGFNDMVFHEGVLYTTDLGFRSGAGRVLAIDTFNRLEVRPFAVFSSETGVVSPTFLALRPGTRAYRAGSGSKGGALLVAYSDFTTISNVTEIEAQLHFVRGRINRDEVVDIADAIWLLSFLFDSGEEPRDIEAADVNADAVVDVADPTYLLSFLFAGGPRPPAPFPEEGPASLGEVQ